MRVGNEGLSVSVVKRSRKCSENDVISRSLLSPRSSDATTHENAGDDGKGPHAAFSIFSSPQLNSPSQHPTL